jgi:release factor glutamine methyltransferase
LPAPRRALDLGTGTGCLLLAALSEFPAAFGIGVDRSPTAVALAAHNAAKLRLADRAAFLIGDWAEAVDGRFDLVLCNPPYIPTSELTGLMPEVARYEPRAALDGGLDGLSSYRRLVSDLPRLLTGTGSAVLELGTGQAESVARLAHDAGLTSEPRQDLAGTTRALVLRRVVP